MPPVIDVSKCTGCGLCAEVCSEDVFFGSEKRKSPVVTYPEACAHCGCCTRQCKIEGAIRLRIPLPLSLLYTEKVW